MPTLYDNFSQVKQYIDQEKPDLTSYVTKTELANASYVTSTALENASYATTTYVADYVAEHGGSGEVTYAYLSENYVAKAGGTLRGNLIPSQSASYNLGSSSSRWKEVRSKFVYTDTAYLQDTSYSSSIIPKETNTYTLGDESHLYYATYSSRLKVGNNSQIYNDGGGITLSVNNNAGIRMGSSNLYPKNNNGMNLGQSSNKWNSTYTSNLYADNLYTYSLTKIHSTSNYNISFNLNGANRFQMDTIAFFPSSNNTRTLGTSALKWAATYTANLYVDNIHNFIWTGTSAEYAALSDYTTYQIYMIKES